MSGAGNIIRASAVLRRRAKGEDHLSDDAYWAVAPRLYDFSKHELKQDPAAPLPSPSPQAPAPAPCGGHLYLLSLQGSGVGWGVRKRVRYVGRHRHRAARQADHGDPPPAAVVEGAVVVQGDEESSSNGKKRDRPEQDEKEAAEASGQDERKVARTEKRKRKAARGRGFTKRRPKKIRPKETEEAEESSQGERKVVCTEENGEMNRPEEAEAEESGQGERKVVVKTQTRRKRENDRGRGVAKRPKKIRQEEVKMNRPAEAEADAEAEESSHDDGKVVVRTEKRRKTARGRGITRRPKKTGRKPAPKVKVEEAKAMVDRWTAQRYAAAEASLLGIMRDHGAHAGQPIPRGKLRQEARKHIGDTGLLDHLLKHVADKVPPGSAERLRRWHNADGAMEYWLEPAGLAALRREAGVADPYWVPPPGWKLGDPVSPDACALEVKRQVEQLATELAGVKRHMEQLMETHQGTVSKEMKSQADNAYISYQPYQDKHDCMGKAKGNLEKQVLSMEEKYEKAARANSKLEVEVLFLKEKYEAVLEKNTRLEEQMAALSTSFLSLKEDLLLLNAGEQLHMLELDVREDCRADRQESNGGKASDAAAVGAGNQMPADAGDGTASTSGGGSGKRTSRKCSVRICKPQGTFQWPEPDTALPASPLTPTANLASMNLPPTPPSASSTNAASAKLPLLPAPASPLQPPPPPPPPTVTRLRDDALQPVQPYSGLDLQLRHTTSTYPPSAALPEGKTTTLDAGAGGGSVGTELALATPSY